MRRHIEVSIGAYVALMALGGSLGGVLLGLVLVRWPVLGCWLLALGVSVLAWWAIYQVVTSGHEPMPQPKRDTASVDGTPVKEVTVLR